MAKKKLWQNWHALGRALTNEAAIRDEGMLHLAAPGGGTFVSIPEWMFDEICPVEIVGDDFVCADFFKKEDFVQIAPPLDLKKVFTWLPPANSKLPDWMHNVYVRNGKFIVTDNETCVKYTTSLSGLDFVIGSHYAGVLKKACSKVEAVKVDPLDTDRDYVTLRFQDGSFFTYTVFKAGAKFEGNADFETCSDEAVFLDPRILRDIEAELSENPKYVVWNKSFFFCDEADLFDDDRGVYFYGLDKLHGAFDGKVFKKVVKAMLAGTGAYIETGDVGEPARFVFTGKDGNVVNGIIGALNA